MIKNIIAFSDLHIRPLKRHEEYKVVFNELATAIRDERPDRVVIAGDIFHTKLLISNEMSVLVSTILNAIAKHTKIIIIPGNHDTVIGSERLDSISPIIEIMNNDNIVYYKESGCFIDKWDSDLVWCVWSCLQNQEAPKIKEFKEANDKDGKKHYIGLYHGVIAGSTTDLGFTFTDEGVDPADFYHTDIFIAGDIHKHQTYNYLNYRDGGWGVMLGSLLQQNFGESLENHGYNYLNYENGKWEHNLVELDNDYDYHTLVLTDFEELENL